MKPLTFLFLTCVVIACQSENNEAANESTTQLNTESQTSHSLVIDTTLIAIIPLKNVEWLNHDYSPATLMNSELSELDSLLTISCLNYNLDTRKSHEELMEFFREDAEFMGETFVENEFSEDLLIRDLNNYRRQYVPYYNKAGEKTVHVFCNCVEFELQNWQTQIGGVNDGGNCHFDAIINLTLKTCEQLMVNGNA